MRRTAITSALLIAGLTAGMTQVRADGATIKESPTPSPNSSPQGIDVSHGLAWYAETNAGKIALQIGGRLAAEYALPNGGAPNLVKIGNGVIWFSDGVNKAIGTLNPTNGAITEYKAPSGAAPFFLALGRDGSVWFSEPAGVGRMAANGSFSEWTFSLEHADDNIEEISLDPSGNLWFAERNFDGSGAAGTNTVRRLNPTTNVVSTFLVPTFGGNPAGVFANPNGTVWVSEYFVNKLALLNPAAAPHTDAVVAPSTGANSSLAGTFRPSFQQLRAPTQTHVHATTSHVVVTVSPGWTEYTIPTANANAEDMRADSHGNLWFEEDLGQLGVLRPSAQIITEYPIPTANSGYYNIALGEEGQLYFTEAALFTAGVPSQVGVLNTDS